MLCFSRRASDGRSEILRKTSLKAHFGGTVWDDTNKKGGGRKSGFKI